MLTRLKINEVSVVDVAANEGCKVLISKRADDADDVHATQWYKEQAAITERQNEEHLRESEGERDALLYEKFLKIFKRTNAPAKPGIEFDLADGKHMKFESERALATWLAINSRLRKLAEETPKMDPLKNLFAFVKAGCIADIAKAIVADDKSYSISEHEFTKLVMEHAKREYPSLSPAAAFEKVFTAQTDESALLRKAHAHVRPSATTSYLFPR